MATCGADISGWTATLNFLQMHLQSCLTISQVAQVSDCNLIFNFANDLLSKTSWVEEQEGKAIDNGLFPAIFLILYHFLFKACNFAIRWLS